jgi:hypothetical protein
LQLRRLGREGLFDIVVNYVRNDYGFPFGGAPVTCVNLSSGFASPMNIMALEYGAQELSLVFRLRPRCISFDEANTAFDLLRQMLIVATDAPDVLIGQLPMVRDRRSIPPAGSAPSAQDAMKSGSNGGAPAPAAVTAFISGAVPAVALWVPFNVTVRDKVPGAVKLADATAYYPQAAIIGGWAAANDYCEPNKETPRQAYQGLGRGKRLYHRQQQ